MNITALTQGIKDPERVNVFVDGEFVLAVDKNTLISQSLSVGKQVSPEFLDQLRDIDTYNLVTRKIVNWMSSRPHSSKEIATKVKDIITKRQARGLNLELDVSGLVEYVIVRLVDLGFDDRSFARWWIEGRRNQAKYGKQKVLAELFSKGIERKLSMELIEEYFPEDTQAGQDLLLRKFGVKSVSEIKDIKLKAKAYRYLASRGFRPV